MKKDLMAARFHAMLAFLFLIITVIICVFAWNSEGLALVGFTIALIASISGMMASLLVGGSYMDAYETAKARADASAVTPHYCGGMH